MEVLKQPINICAIYMQWFFHTKTYCTMHGRFEGTTGDVDDQFAERARENFGATVRQFLRAGLIDSLHLASLPVLLGQSERLFDGVYLRALGLGITERKSSKYATHLSLGEGLRGELPASPRAGFVFANFQMLDSHL